MKLLLKLRSLKFHTSQSKQGAELKIKCQITYTNTIKRQFCKLHMEFDLNLKCQIRVRLDILLRTD